MNQELSRRNLLEGAGTLMTTPALAPFASNPAMAATAGASSPMAKHLRTGRHARQRIVQLQPAHAAQGGAGHADSDGFRAGRVPPIPRPVEATGLSA